MLNAKSVLITKRKKIFQQIRHTIQQKGIDSPEVTQLWKLFDECTSQIRLLDRDNYIRKITRHHENLGGMFFHILKNCSIHV